MANSKQAKKRIRQNTVRRSAKMAQRSMVRTIIKKVHLAIQDKDHTTAMTIFKVATTIIDRMSNKGIIHQNKAARLKSRLNGQIKALTA